MGNNNQSHCLRSFSKALYIKFSDLVSNELLASSKINIAGFLNKVRANVILCLCPPDKFISLKTNS